MRDRRIVRKGLAALLLAAVAGCAGPAASPSVTSTPILPTPSAEASETASPAPTRTPELSVAPTTAATPAGPFASTVYPYTFQLPPGVSNRNWLPALFAWDGEAKLGTASRANDLTGTVDGTLMVFGLPWDDDLASFFTLASDNAARFHGCHEVDEVKAFEVNGVAGLSQGEVCELGTDARSTVLLNDGYGLAVRMMVNADKVDVVYEHLVLWLDGLTWTNG